jgi:DNA-binding transcriptional regulator YdaS (Cro superfamily)
MLGWSTTLIERHKVGYEFDSTRGETYSTVSLTAKEVSTRLGVSPESVEHLAQFVGNGAPDRCLLVHRPATDERRRRAEAPVQVDEPARAGAPA